MNAEFMTTLRGFAISLLTKLHYSSLKSYSKLVICPQVVIYVRIGVITSGSTALILVMTRWKGA